VFRRVDSAVALYSSLHNEGVLAKTRWWGGRYYSERK